MNPDGIHLNFFGSNYNYSEVVALLLLALFLAACALLYLVILEIAHTPTSLLLARLHFWISLASIVVFFVAYRHLFKTQGSNVSEMIHETKQTLAVTASGLYGFLVAQFIFIGNLIWSFSRRDKINSNPDPA
ncbi:MAG TPA: hypothetical protein VGR55_12440 [Candidatus Acidoferrum sp.]|nr:hypothetical protein [Candidatus Acidoferrum sp.]